MVSVDHTCAPSTDRALFCTCGKLVDREGLRSVKVQGFSGGASLSPAMETFWATGDPAVFDKNPARRAGELARTAAELKHAPA